MKETFRTGMCFGLTSGIITTLGMIVGLQSGTHSVLAVIGGILTLAVADAFSDSLGMHVSQESNKKKDREIMESTASIFLVKLIFPLSFLIPIVLLSLDAAIIADVLWGMIVLAALSYFIAKSNGTKPLNVITEHVGVATVVVFVTHYVGYAISMFFV
jgi:vacuolar iron transporter family protein